MCPFSKHSSLQLLPYAFRSQRYDCRSHSQFSIRKFIPSPLMASISAGQYVKARIFARTFDPTEILANIPSAVLSSWPPPFIRPCMYCAKFVYFSSQSCSPISGVNQGYLVKLVGLMLPFIAFLRPYLFGNHRSYT